MDTASSHSPELPLPQGEIKRTDGGVEATPGPSPEKKVGNTEGPGSGQNTSSQQTIVQDQAKAASSISTIIGDNSAQASSQTALMSGDDVDVIEKEWVAKAKAIVDRTRNDPGEQSRELSKFKAEYLKHRFNKDIKLTDENRQ